MSNILGKKEFIDLVKTSLNEAGEDFSQKQVAVVLDSILANIEHIVRNGGEVKFQNFGSFHLKHTKERTARKSFTSKETITVPSKKKFSFKLSPALNKDINS